MSLESGQESRCRFDRPPGLVETLACRLQSGKAAYGWKPPAALYVDAVFLTRSQEDTQ
jgi:hypothetical protein